MRKILASLGILAALVGTGLIAPATTLAAVSSVQIFEDTYFNGDSNTWYNHHGGYNLGHWNTNLRGGCNGAFGVAANNWNDCMSSFKMTILAGFCARIMTDSNGGGYVIWSDYSISGTDNVAFVTVSRNDEASSIQFGVTTDNQGHCRWTTGDFV